MISTKSDQKNVLLLQPHRLLSDHHLLECLQITKEKGIPKYVNSELNSAELNKNFSKLPKEVKDSLLHFSKERIALMKEEIQKKFTLQRAGVSYEVYSRSAIARRLHELMERMKPFAALVKWYHKVPGEKGNFKTAPGSFSTFKPQLQFEVTKNGNALQLNTIISINGAAYGLDQFTRWQFLLLSGGEYFILSFKDYQTLEWLQDNDPQQYSQQPQEFSETILAKLESSDYTVNRNNLFQKHEIRELPVNRVLLSEISQSFLVLTPQWEYDGFITEGPWKETYELTRNGQSFAIYRNQQAEKDLWQLLEGLHPNFEKQLNGYYYLSFEEAQKKQWFLKVYHKLLDLNIQVIGMDMLQHFRYSQHKVKTDVTIQKEVTDALVLHMVISFGEEEVALTEVQKIILAGQRAILLQDGSLGILHEEWLQTYGTIVRHGKISKQEIQVPRWLAFSEEKTTEGTGVLKTVLQAGWLEKWQHWQQDGTMVYEVPATVQAKLRPYQQKGFEWMLLLAEAGAGACLADDMGLGKTLQTISLLTHQLTQKASQRHLIVAPSSLIYNWSQELQKFAPHVKVLIYHGGGRNIQEAATGDYQVVITSYGTVRQDIEEMCLIGFGTIVLDESHNIKNPAAQITKAVERLQSNFRVALSGTPVMNNTFDLYAQMNFLLPGIFGTREFFRREYADAIDTHRDGEKIKTLQRITAPFVLRRTKEQVAGDLPAKTEMVMWCKMSDAQKRLYDEVKDSIRQSVFLNIENEGLGKSKLAVLQGMLKLRQICNSPLLLPGEEQTCNDSVKTDLLMNELQNNLKDQKVLVFSQFTTMLNLLAEKCREEGITYYHLDGSTAPEKRIEMVNRFQEDGNTTNVFLISLKAGNAGLNLTAAGYVFLFDPWWNTAVQQQAIDRTHRIGQTKNVFAYKMICKDTIEEKIIQLQQHKKQLAEELISEDEGFVKSLTEDDIKYLFS
ncbi:DEAD/DEAH box helicase [Niastella populi]|uniref:Helicase SNF2 n=1 Tax=Niastella populi TaxID=550983 RepID=A0A1V9FGF2_9BACT|nr:DEAD/DEAH box helicase [Niastella populi]OQP57445.1 helicase SNF2 [Niastella populi]